MSQDSAAFGLIIQEMDVESKAESVSDIDMNVVETFK